MGLDSALFIDDLLFFNCEEIVDSENKDKRRFNSPQM